MSEKNPKQSPKVKETARRKRVLELRTRGLTIEGIKEVLKTQDGIDVAYITVKRDLQSVQANEFSDELVRQQLADITTSNEPRLRLEFRDRILDKIIPRRAKIQQNIKQEVSGDLKVGADIDQLIAQYSSVIENVANRDLQKNNPREQVDTTHTNP